MAPIRQGPEAACAAVVGTLQTWLPGAIDDEWTAWSGAGGDPTDEKAPPKVYPRHYYKFRHELVNAGNYPAIIVSPHSSRMLANHMTTPNIAGAAWDLEQHRLIVSVGLLGSNIYNLQVACTRLIHAVRTTLLKHPELNGDATNLLAGYSGELDLGTYGVGDAAEFGHGNRPSLMQLWAGCEVLLQVMEIIQ